MDSATPASTHPALATTSDCAHRPTCPGCPMFGRPAAEQLDVKRRRVIVALERYPELAGVGVDRVAPAAPALGYRRRVKLAVGSSGAIGLYALGTHTVVDAPECRIVAARLGRVLAELRCALAEPGAAISAVDVRDTSSGVLLTLVSESEPRSLRPLAEQLVRKVPDLASVAASRRRADSAQLLGRDLEVLSGPDSVRDAGDGTEPWTIAAHGAFVQAHAGQARAIRDRIAATVDSVAGCRVLELHSGSGALALGLARRGATVTAIEQFGPAAERTRRAAREQNLDVDVLVGDALERTAPLIAARRRFDVIVVNPPRRGLEPELRAALAEFGATCLVYVSCAPETLARDLADFRRLGLGVAELQPFDMIPQSAEVETLVRLVPAALAPPQVLEEDERLIAVVKPPHEPTTPQGGRDDSLLRRVRLHAGAARAVPVHRLDADTSGVVLFARTPEFVADIARALALGEKCYAALVRGVAREKGVVNRPLRERGARIEARTRYRRISVVAGHSLLRVRPDHGRKHQIRRHLVEVGHPVLGDARYGHEPSNRHFEHRHGLERSFLHCSSIELVLDGVARRFEAPLAGDLDAVLDSLRAPAAEPAEF